MELRKISFNGCKDNLIDYVGEITEATAQIRAEFDFLVKTNSPSPNHSLVLDNMQSVLSVWQSNTYLGVMKPSVLRSVFHRFFEAVLDLILTMRSSISEDDRDYANNSLYQGRVYRWLGYSGGEDEDKDVIVNYDNLYASWSTLPRCSYTLSKLYGKVKRVTLDIPVGHFGLYLPVLSCEFTKVHEQEVVFPVLEEYVVAVELKEDICGPYAD